MFKEGTDSLVTFGWDVRAQFGATSSYIFHYFSPIVLLSSIRI